MTNQNRFLALGAACLVAIVGYVGVDMFFDAKARKEGRVAAINQAREIVNFISADETSFGTAFRDGALACMTAVSDTPLPRPVLDHYLAVLKAAAAYASDESFAPRNNSRWFQEAQSVAARELPLDNTVLEKLETSEREKISNALADIDANMAQIGDCLHRLAKG